jgi:uncharacterized membrane protein YqjE
MNEGQDTGSGALAAGAQLLKALGDLVESRLELFLVELQEERARTFDTLVLAVVAVICALMALIVGTFAVVVIFWETHRVLVLVSFAVAYATIALTALLLLRTRLRRWRAFAATLDQIKKDRSCFTEPN